MLDIKFIRENPEQVKDSIKRRQTNVDVDEILALDKQYRNLLKKTENLKAQRNKLSAGKIKPSPEIIAQGGKSSKKLNK